MTVLASLMFSTVLPWPWLWSHNSQHARSNLLGNQFFQEIIGVIICWQFVLEAWVLSSFLMSSVHRSHSLRFKYQHFDESKYLDGNHEWVSHLMVSMREVQAGNVHALILGWKKIIKLPVPKSGTTFQPGCNKLGKHWWIPTCRTHGANNLAFSSGLSNLSIMSCERWHEPKIIQNMRHGMLWIVMVLFLINISWSVAILKIVELPSSM